MLVHARDAEQAMLRVSTLDGVGRLAERERPGTVTLLNAKTLVALGAQRSPHPSQGQHRPRPRAEERPFHEDMPAMTSARNSGTGGCPFTISSPHWSSKVSSRRARTFERPRCKVRTWMGR